MKNPAKIFPRCLFPICCGLIITLLFFVGSIPTRKALQFAILDMLWDNIHDDFLYIDQNEDALIRQKGEIVQAINREMNMLEFYGLVISEVENLGDNHSRYIPPKCVTREMCIYPNGHGHGAFLFPLSRKGEVFVIDVWPESPAGQAGIKANDIILSVNNEEAIDENDKIRCIPPNQNLILLIQRGSETLRSVQFRTGSENFFYPMHWLVKLGKNNTNIGYIRILGFDKMSSAYFRYSIMQISSYPNLTGLILDVRLNEGGEIGYLKDLLSFFITGRQGYFNSRIARLDQSPFNIPELNDQNGTATIPLIVLVSANTQSSGELFAGILQDSGRAYLIGEKTSGNTESLVKYSFPDGSNLFLSVLQYQADVSNSNWPIDGIIPDKVVHFDWETYFSDNDQAIIESILFFEQLRE